MTLNTFKIEFREAGSDDEPNVEIKKSGETKIFGKVIPGISKVAH